MKYDPKQINSLTHTLREFENTAVELNIDIFIKLCNKHNICPSCGRAATKFSKTNHNCNECRNRFNNQKARCKGSIPDTYVRTWTNTVASRYNFYKIYTKIKQSETTALYLMATANECLAQIQDYKLRADNKEIEYPQEEVKKLEQRLKGIHQSFNLIKTNKKQEPKSTNIQKLSSYILEKLGYNISAEKVIEECIRQNRCPICGAIIPTNNRGSMCSKTCGTKISSFKYRYKNIKDEKTLWVAFHASTAKNRLAFISLINTVCDSENFIEVRKKAIQRHCEELQAKLEKLETERNEIYAKIQSFYTKWMELENSLKNEPKRKIDYFRLEANLDILN